MDNKNINVDNEAPKDKWEIIGKIIDKVNEKRTATTTVFRCPGVLSLLTILFVGLKLTGYITWSWWWVLAPTIIPICVAVIVLIILSILIGYAIYKLD